MDRILRKCRSLSKVGRSYSYVNLRSKSARGGAAHYEEEEGDEQWRRSMSAAAEGGGGGGYDGGGVDEVATVLVGRKRRRYSISSKHLNHPVMSALIDRSASSPAAAKEELGVGEVRVKCEVVLFDHLLWMLENVDAVTEDAAALQELIELYACS